MNATDSQLTQQVIFLFFLWNSQNGLLPDLHLLKIIGGSGCCGQCQVDSGLMAFSAGQFCCQAVFTGHFCKNRHCVHQLSMYTVWKLRSVEEVSLDCAPETPTIWSGCLKLWLLFLLDLLEWLFFQMWPCDSVHFSTLPVAVLFDHTFSVSMLVNEHNASFPPGAFLGKRRRKRGLLEWNQFWTR